MAAGVLAALAAVATSAAPAPAASPSRGDKGAAPATLMGRPRKRRPGGGGGLSGGHLGAGVRKGAVSASAWLRCMARKPLPALSSCHCNGTLTNVNGPSGSFSPPIGRKCAEAGWCLHQVVDYSLRRRVGSASYLA